MWGVCNAVYVSVSGFIKNNHTSEYFEIVLVNSYLYNRNFLCMSCSGIFYKCVQLNQFIFFCMGSI